MGMSWDWSPVLTALNGLSQQTMQKAQYQSAVKGLIGSQQPNPVQVTPQVSQPNLPQLPGGTPLNDPARQAAYNAPVQSYSGPLGQSLGEQAGPLAALLNGMPPGMGMQLLPQIAMSQINRQQTLQDKAQEPYTLSPGQTRYAGSTQVASVPEEQNKTLTAQEASARGLPVLQDGSFYQVSPKNDVSVVKTSDLLSPGRIDQEAKLHKQEAADTANAQEGVAPDPSTVHYWAQSVAAGGAMPVLGMGKQAAAYRQAILQEVANVNGSRGMTGADQNAATATTKANTGSLAKITPLRAATEAYEGTMLQNMDLAKGLISKGAGTTGAPVLNRWQNYIRGQYAGDPDVAKFNTAIQTVKNEYAKIQSGSIGNAPVTDSARQEAERMLDPSQTPQQIMANFDYMVKETGNRTRALREQERSLKSGLSGHSDVPNIPGQLAPQVAPGGSANVLHYDAQGNRVP